MRHHPEKPGRVGPTERQLASPGLNLVVTLDGRNIDDDGNTRLSKFGTEFRERIRCGETMRTYK